MADVAAEDSLDEVHGLRTFLEDRLAHRSGQGGRASWLILDALGLGLEQTLRFISTARPDYARFKRWIIETAGRPDPLVVQRLNASLGDAPPPHAVLDQLALIETMAPVLDTADLAQWDAEGYVILRGALSASEARAVETLLWAEAGATPHDPDSWYAAPGNGIMIQRFQHPAMDAARRSARVHKAFAQLWGKADLWMTIDRLSFNPPLRPGYSYREVGLHWDGSLARPMTFATQGILYLTDTPPEQGALRLVPGFHRGLDAWLDGLGGADPREVNMDDQARYIGAGAGDLIIWRNALPHGASPNTGIRPRLAQYVNMYPADLKPNPVWL